jgi:hypothetical protein
MLELAGEEATGLTRMITGRILKNESKKDSEYLVEKSLGLMSETVFSETKWR